MKEPSKVEERKEPSTPEEWQFCVDVSEAVLLLDSSRQYGLITYRDGWLNVDRAVQLLSDGEKLGYRPSKENAQQIAIDMATGRK